MAHFVAYGGLLFGVFCLGWLGISAKSRFGEMTMLKTILDIVNFITKQFEFKYREDITRVIKYVLEALDFIDTYESAVNMEIRKELIIEKTLIICEEEGIDIGDGTIVEIVNRLVEYVIAQEIAESIEI